MDEQLLKKLNYKERDSVLVINSPEGYAERLQGVDYDTQPQKKYDFVQIFLYKKEEIPQYFNVGVDNLAKGGKLWFCYAKKSSELYTDISRDEGWDAADTYDFVAVRQIAIDDNWSALRFKPSSEVKNIKRKSSSDKKEKESSKQDLFLPSSFQKALNANPYSKHNFQNLSYTHQKEYVEWVTSAKKEETAKKRLDKTIEMLQEGKKHPNDK